MRIRLGKYTFFAMLRTGIDERRWFPNVGVSTTNKVIVRVSLKPPFVRFDD